MVEGTGGEFVAFGLDHELLRLGRRCARRRKNRSLGFACLRRQARDDTSGCGHRARSCIVFAAWRTASTMRGCVPQRQMLPCKNCAISVELGWGLLCKRPTLLMIMPGVQ